MLREDRVRVARSMRAVVPIIVSLLFARAAAAPVNLPSTCPLVPHAPILDEELWDQNVSPEGGAGGGAAVSSFTQAVGGGGARDGGRI